MLDRGRLEAAIREMLLAIGEDPKREGLVDTPARVVRAYAEMLGGYDDDPQALLKRTFSAEGYDEVIALRDISFYSMCEHHLLPFSGKVSIAYLPGERVVGLSKLARLVQVYAKRLQLQERMTAQIAKALMLDLGARGAAVIVRARHLCMGARGARQPSAVMLTSSMQGVFRENSSARAEALSLLGSNDRRD